MLATGNPRKSSGKSTLNIYKWTMVSLCQVTSEVQATLFNYFNTSTGHNRKLNRVLDHPKVNSEFPAWPPDLEVPFLQRAKLIRNAVRTFPLE